jgi:hypothetical protein
MNIMTPYANFDLSAIESCSEIPACRGPEVLAILVGIDPICGKETEEYPHIYPKDYPERVEKFCGNCRFGAAGVSNHKWRPTAILQSVPRLAPCYDSGHFRHTY